MRSQPKATAHVASSDLDTGLPAVDGTGFLRRCWRLEDARVIRRQSQFWKGARATGAPFLFDGRHAMKLLIGNRNYSTWSLRPWLVLQAFRHPVRGRSAAAGGRGLARRCWRSARRAGKVPVLIDGDLVVPETIAIIEYLADRFPDKAIWPAESRRAGAGARRSGRNACRLQRPAQPRADEPAGLPSRQGQRSMRSPTTCTGSKRCGAACWHSSGGPFLFGEFTAADAMFAPVATRIRTYELPVSDVAARICRGDLRPAGVPGMAGAGAARSPGSSTTTRSTSSRAGSSRARWHDAYDQALRRRRHAGGARKLSRRARALVGRRLWRGRACPPHPHDAQARRRDGGQGLDLLGDRRASSAASPSCGWPKHTNAEGMDCCDIIMAPRHGAHRALAQAAVPGLALPRAGRRAARYGRQ